MDLRRAEINAVSVYVIDTIVDGIVRYVTLEHEAADYMDWSEQDAAWQQLVEHLPA